MKVMITGIDGFIASHLVDYILQNEKDVEIYGTIRRMADRKNIKHFESEINLLEMELIDSYSVFKAVRTATPDKVFHLAGQSFVPTSWSSPDNTMMVNANGTINVLEAVRTVSPSAYVQIAGTSEEYGKVYPEECPINESQPLRPLSPYAVSKIAADFLGYQYAKSYDMNILRTRTFNQTGSRRGLAFVDSNFACQIAKIEKTLEEPIIKHGNLSAIRDFTNVKDTVKAYWLLSDKKWEGDIINVCSGNGKSIYEVIRELVNNSTAKSIISMREDPNRMRPSDVPLLIGDNSKLKSHINWEPKISWEDSMKELLDYWRGII